MRPPDFWNNNGIIACALSPLGSLYGFATAVKSRLATPFRSRARVLCVGNLTAGGTGKTPLAIALAQMLRARGATTVFLSRGHGGSLAGPIIVDPAKHDANDVGDEPLLLARHGTAIVARNRAAGASLADSLGADVIIMDDGFQNFAIEKDVSLLVIDAETGLANGRILPAGPLRESAAQGFARASALVLMGEGAPELPHFFEPVLRARLIPSAPRNLKGQSVFAFAGIGRPEKFFATLRAEGVTLAGAQAFPDHHPYSQLELAGLRAIAADLGLPLITTEKDYVRIAPGQRRDILTLPVHAVLAPDPAWDVLLDIVSPAASQPHP